MFIHVANAIIKKTNIFFIYYLSLQFKDSFSVAKILNKGKKA